MKIRHERDDIFKNGVSKKGVENFYLSNGINKPYQIFVIRNGTGYMFGAVSYLTISTSEFRISSGKPGTTSTCSLGRGGSGRLGGLAAADLPTRRRERLTTALRLRRLSCRCTPGDSGNAKLFGFSQLNAIGTGFQQHQIAYTASELKTKYRKCTGNVTET
jgi:hypothetical protein